VCVRPLQGGPIGCSPPHASLEGSFHVWPWGSLDNRPRGLSHATPLGGCYVTDHDPCPAHAGGVVSTLTGGFPHSLFWNCACKVLHSATKRAKERVKRTSSARVMLDFLQTGRHPQEQIGLGGSSSVRERFEQVQLHFFAQVGREETDSDVCSWIGPLPARCRPHVCR